jgi:hypothetical protein
MSLYSKLIRSCSRHSLNAVLKDIVFKNIPQNLLNSQSFSAHAYMNGIYDKETTSSKNEDHVNNSTVNFRTNRSSRYMKYSMRYSNLPSNDNSFLVFSNQIQDLIASTIFMLYDYCPNCLRKTKAKISVEEILAGFKKERSTFFTVCNVCFTKMFPRIYFINTKTQNLDKINSVNFLSPIVLLKEVDNLIQNYGEKHYYISDYFKHNEHKHIFWNLVFYFGILGLPCFVLYILKNEDKIKTLMESLEFFKTMDLSKRATSLTALTSSVSSGRFSSCSHEVTCDSENLMIKTNIKHYESIIQGKM